MLFRPGSNRRLASALAAVLGCIILMTMPVAAQQQSGASAAIVASFLANPDKLLQDNPNGGEPLIAAVRDLLVGDQGTLQQIIGLVSGANDAQKSAIGAGLAQAARLVVQTNPDYATRIQTGAVNLNDQQVLLAYTSVTGERPIAATGAGGGGAIGGPTNGLPTGTGGNGPAVGIGNGGTPTSPFSYTSGVAGLSSAFSNFTTSGTVNTLSSPISP